LISGSELLEEIPVPLQGPPVQCLKMARVGCRGRGRAVPLCPGTSDVNLFGYGEGVVDFNAQVTHRALYFLVPQQKLDGP
jgi:hypothetical protein